MVKTAITLLGIALVAATWWYVFDSRAPREADDAIPLEALRTAIAADDARHLPREVELYRTGRGTAPMFAVEAGGGLGKFEMAYTAFGIRYRDSRVMIDAAADRETAMAIGDKAAARFDDAAYALLLDRIAQADQVILTHEHKDHVMAVVIAGPKRSQRRSAPSRPRQSTGPRILRPGSRPFLRQVTRRAASSFSSASPTAGSIFLSETLRGVLTTSRNCAPARDSCSGSCSIPRKSAAKSCGSCARSMTCIFANRRW